MNIFNDKLITDFMKGDVVFKVTSINGDTIGTVENNKTSSAQCKDLRLYIPWANLEYIEDENRLIVLEDTKNWGSIENKNTLVVLKLGVTIVGIASLRYNPDGIGLGGQIDYPNIKWKLAWVEVNDSCRKQGYGTKIVTWIRDTFANLKTPIALYAREWSVKVPFEYWMWYYKLGAIILCNHDDSDHFMCFMAVDQITEYIGDEDVDHDAKGTIEFEKEHSQRVGFCKNYNMCGEDYLCNYLLKNSETECSDCREGVIWAFRTGSIDKLDVEKLVAAFCSNDWATKAFICPIGLYDGVKLKRIDNPALRWDPKFDQILDDIENKKAYLGGRCTLDGSVIFHVRRGSPKTRIEIEKFLVGLNYGGKPTHYGKTTVSFHLNGRYVRSFGI